MIHALWALSSAECAWEFWWGVMTTTAGTTWINFVWNAPTGYSDFEVTFDGETESISRNSLLCVWSEWWHAISFQRENGGQRREVEFGCERYR